MKRLIESVEFGFESLMGERITLFCANYIYTGKLIGVNDMFVQLEDPAIVYDTGPFTDKEWKNAQALPNNWQVQLQGVESWGILK
jgi:hypothetical protein